MSSSGLPSEKVRVAQFGLGPIGIECIRLASDRPWAEVVGGIDIDPHKQQRHLGELVGHPALEGALVYPSFEALLRHTKPHVVVHTASSHIEPTLEQLLPMVHAGVSVVSSCEELAFPSLRAPKAAEALDRACRASGARVVGGGVNPGFVMDLLPLVLTSVCCEVRSVFARRVVHAASRRLPLQRKIGSGLDPAAFRSLWSEGNIGHAGFRESVALVAHALSWKLDSIEESCEPLIAQRDIETAYLRVRAGQTSGLHQRALGRVAGEVRIELDLSMDLDAQDPHDLIKIDGRPPIEVHVRGGVSGDDATVGALVSAIPAVLEAPPGLLLATDLAVPRWR